MLTLLVWWYLVTFSASDPWVGGTLIGEYQSLEGDNGCEIQRRIYLARNPLGFADCEGSVVRQNFTTIDARRKLDIEERKLELEEQRLRSAPKRLEVETMTLDLQYESAVSIDRRRRDLELRRLELEVENKTLEVEIKRRSLENR